MRAASFLIGLCAVCYPVASAANYEVRMYRVAMPINVELKATLDQHFSQPLDSVIQDQNPNQKGLHLLTILPPSNWDGSDLLAHTGVEGGDNAIPIEDSQRLFVGRETPVEYLKPRSDGRFDRKVGYVQHGLQVAVRRNGFGQTRVWATLTRPGPRQPLDGVSLDVGPPTQDEETVWTNLIMHTSLGQWAAALFAVREENESQPELLLVFLRDLSERSEFEPASEQTTPITPVQFSVEAKFMSVPRGHLFDNMFIADENAVPIAGNGQRIVAIKPPNWARSVPPKDFDWAYFLTTYGKEGVELLSAPRVTTMAGLTDREDTSRASFKAVLKGDPKGFDGGGGPGGGGSAAGGFGGGGPSPKSGQFTNIMDLLSDRSTLLGLFILSDGPGKPAVIFDITTHSRERSDDEGSGKDGTKQDYTGIMAGVRIACDSAVENIVLDVALIERYPMPSPAIRKLRKGSPARPIPIETTVASEFEPPRIIERSCWFRQPTEDGETLAFLLRDDVRDDRTLVFVTIECVEGGPAVLSPDPN